VSFSVLAYEKPFVLKREGLDNKAFTPEWAMEPRWFGTKARPTAVVLHRRAQ
jgi:hypothetical protein